MKLWKLNYRLSCTFSDPIVDHHYTLRCFPKECHTQRIVHSRFEVDPSSTYGRGQDGFGNRLLLGYINKPHDTFGMSLQALILKESQPEPEMRGLHRLGMYRYPSALTSMGDTLTAFYRNLPGSTTQADIADGCKGAARERVRELMAALFAVFTYESGSTHFATTAEEAFAQGKGVCQDYAHILLALCRAEGMTARYAAGTIPGEGETHAWIEVLIDGCWQGFDPTNNKETDEEYILFAVGRDAFDCGLNRGVFRGGYETGQTVHVIMEGF